MNKDVAIALERAAETAEESKARKYEDLKEQFINDEISEEEMERRMDELFESGDEFLDADLNDDPDLTGEAAFRFKEIGQIVVVFGLLAVAGYVFLLTKGAALPVMIALAIIVALAYARYKGKI